MGKRDELAMYFHGKYMQRLENELSLNWQRINIGLIALIGSIAGFGIIARGKDGAIHIVTQTPLSAESILLYVISSLAVLVMVVYMLILINQGRYWYLVNETKVVWLENALLTKNYVMPVHDNLLTKSIYQLGNPDYKSFRRLTIYRGIKLPLYLTGFVFGHLATFNGVLLVGPEYINPSAFSKTLIAFITSIILIIIHKEINRRSKGSVDINGMETTHPIDIASLNDIITMISHVESNGGSKSHRAEGAVDS